MRKEVGYNPPPERSYRPDKPPPPPPPKHTNPSVEVGEGSLKFTILICITPTALLIYLIYFLLSN